MAEMWSTLEIRNLLKDPGITAKYLANKVAIPFNKKVREGNGKEIVLTGATGNNLKKVKLRLPLGKFIAVTGVSGSGKSSLINGTLYPILRAHYYKSMPTVSTV